MPYIVISSALFSGGDRADSEDFILGLLGALCRRDLKWLQAHPDTPKLYDSGVVYALPEQMDECKIPDGKLRECERYLRGLGAADETVNTILAFLHGVEMFRDVPTIIKKGAVDCDNLASWRVAELWLAGIAAAPYITWRETGGGTTYHALVMHPDGTSEDPSRILGLGTEAERVEERRKNRERQDTFVQAARAMVNDGAMTLREAVDKIAGLGFVGKKWPTP